MKHGWNITMFRRSSPTLTLLVAAFLKTMSHGGSLKSGCLRNACSFFFPAERDSKTGTVLRFPGWRYIRQEGWTGAVTEHSGVCFMAAVRGSEKDRAVSYTTQGVDSRGSHADESSGRIYVPMNL